MSRGRLADAYEELAALHVKVADQYAQVAHELRGVEQPGPASARVAPAPSPETHAAVVDEGECPKHHRAWKIGKFGPFCSQPTDDPAWGKERGDKIWCSITPKNAPKWLEINGAAA